MEEPAEFVGGDRDHFLGVGGADGGCGGQERVSGDDQGGPMVPGPPATMLMLVKAEIGLRGLERLLDPPPRSGDGDQLRQWDGLR